MLAVQVHLNGIGNPGLGGIGWGDADTGDQATVEVSEDMVFVAIDPLPSALATMAHVGVFNRDPTIADHTLLQWIRLLILYRCSSCTGSSVQLVQEFFINFLLQIPCGIADR